MEGFVTPMMGISGFFSILPLRWSRFVTLRVLAGY